MTARRGRTMAHPRTRQNAGQAGAQECESADSAENLIGGEAGEMGRRQMHSFLYTVLQTSKLIHGQ